MKILEKVTISILSTLIFSLLLTFWEYTPVAEQQTDGGYFSFQALFLIYSISSLPIYVIGGGLYSYFVELYIEEIQFRNRIIKYITESLLYIAGGLLIIGILLVIIWLAKGTLAGTSIAISFSLGALAALLFYLTSLVFKKALRLIER